MKKFAQILIITFAALTGSRCNLEKIDDDITGGGNGPTALFSVDKTSCEAPCAVTFTNESENGDKYFWDFKNGQTSQSENPGTINFTTPANYQVVLIVTATNGKKDTFSLQISIVAPGITPTPGFSIGNNGCIAECEVSFTNTTLNGMSYSWDFGDPDSGAENTSEATNPVHIYSKQGTYTVTLEATNGGQTASIQHDVTIGGIVKFSKSFNPGSLNTNCYGATQRPDGSFHLFYNLSGLKSAIISNSSTPQLTGQVSLPLDLAVNKTTQYNGGFLISGEKSGNIKVSIIDQAQTKKMEKTLTFQGDNSVGQGIIINGNGDLAITGLRQEPTPYFPGFATISQTGVILSDPVINNISLEYFGGVSIAQKTTGEYFITSNYYNPPGGDFAQLLNVSVSGGFSGKTSLAPVHFGNKIIKLNGNNFAVLGRSLGGVIYVLGINQNGSVAWERELTGLSGGADILYTSDGEIAVCGHKSSGALYWAKFPATGGSGFTWQNEVSGNNGAIQGISIAATADGGFLILGQYDNSGKSEPWLVKTDALGQFQ